MRRAADTPAEVAAGLERGQPLPGGSGERYLGYGILGVAFASGDLLALRRFPVASSGCGYTALWHRSPDGAWTFYTDATCDQGCTSHFAPALDRLAVAPIRLEWTDPWTLSIGVDGGREIAWTVSVASSWRTRLLTALAAAAPAALWARPARAGAGRRGHARTAGDRPAPAGRPPPERRALPVEPAAGLGDRRQPGVDPRRRPGHDDAPSASRRPRRLRHSPLRAAGERSARDHAA